MVHTNAIIAHLFTPLTARDFRLLQLIRVQDEISREWQST